MRVRFQGTKVQRSLGSEVKYAKNSIKNAANAAFVASEKNGAHKRPAVPPSNQKKNATNAAF